VELCGGSAALSLAVDGLKPPIYYRGGKRRFAREILKYLPPVRPYLVNDPGPWSEFWRTVSDEETAVEVRYNVRDLAYPSEPRVLFKRLAGQQVPDDVGERVACWVVLQHYAYASRPVYRSEDSWSWVTPGFCGASADRAAQRERALAAGNKDAHRWATRSRTLLDVVRDLEALQGKIRFAVADRGAVELVRSTQIPEDAVVYIDPLYEGYSSGYSHNLSRADVLGLATELASARRMVVVSEAEPLLLAGARHVQLSGPRGGGATSSRVKSEWLTILGG
jgi:hypothetical protein